MSPEELASLTEEWGATHVKGPHTESGHSIYRSIYRAEINRRGAALAELVGENERLRALLRDGVTTLVKEYEIGHIKRRDAFLKAAQAVLEVKALSAAAAVKGGTK